MIDLTPLDVRKKRGDFRKGLRGYDPREVDTFLDLVAERLEELVRETLTLHERTDRLQRHVTSLEGREKAVQDALVTAQQLREEVREQAQREAEFLRREAQGDAQRLLEETRRVIGKRRGALDELERKRLRVLKSFRALLQRELDMVEVEENRVPLEDRPTEPDAGASRAAPRGASAPMEEGPSGSRESGPGTGAAGGPQGAPGTPARAVGQDVELWFSSILEEDEGRETGGGS